MGRALIFDLWKASLPSVVPSIFSPFFADDNGMHAGAKDGLLERCTYRLPNAGAHLLPEAGATEERTLEAVRCSAVLGVARVWRNAPVAAWLRSHAPTGSPVA